MKSTKKISPWISENPKIVLLLFIILGLILLTKAGIMPYLEAIVPVLMIVEIVLLIWSNAKHLFGGHNNNEVPKRSKKEEFNKKILCKYNISELPDYPSQLKEFVTCNRADELTKALTYLKNHRILLISGIGGVGKTTLARALIETYY